MISWQPGDPVAGFLLTHGAGSGATHPTSLALEAAMAPVPLRRMEFPYRKAGRRAPDRAPVLVQSIRDEAAEMVDGIGDADSSSFLFGGRSMGGRMCSMAIADGLPAAGLVLLSYPLHPPGRPDKLRVEHLPAVTVPTLVISGTNDPFGTPDELREHLSAIAGTVTFVWVEGVGHEWRGMDGQVATVVANWVRGADLPERIVKAPRTGKANRIKSDAP